MLSSDCMVYPLCFFFWLTLNKKILEVAATKTRLSINFHLHSSHCLTKKNHLIRHIKVITHWIQFPLSKLWAGKSLCCHFYSIFVASATTNAIYYLHVRFVAYGIRTKESHAQINRPPKKKAVIYQQRQQQQRSNRKRKATRLAVRPQRPCQCQDSTASGMLCSAGLQCAAARQCCW
jgi:hypothetical protein